MSRSREREIDVARAAIRAEAPYDYRRETRWQYDNRLAAAARDALANEPADPSPSGPASQLERGINAPNRDHNEQEQR